MSTRTINLAGIVVLVALCVLALAGCSRLPRVALHGKATATGHRDAGTPATVASSGSVSTIQIPAGSTVAAIPATDTAPAHSVVTLSAPSEMRTETRADTATTGAIDTETAQHRIDSDRRAGLARTQMLVGIGLIVGGALLAFALPPALRWPQAGIYVAAAGLVLVLLRDPPTWLLAALFTAAAVTVIAYHSTRRSPSLQ